MPRTPAAYGLSIAALTLTFAFLGAGCERPGCENAERCVEQCFTPAFKQCSGCPTGSFVEELCTRPTTCVREVGRPRGTCASSNCTSGDNGRCTVTAEEEVCTYDVCERDSDCTEGLRCACGGGHLAAHVCVPATCEQPEDCGDYPCSPVPGCGGPGDPVNGGAAVLACHGVGDECYSNLDCTEGQFCTLDVADPAAGGGTWRCREPFCS